MSTDYTLAYGTHARPEDGRCAMEWVSHLAGEAHSDEPTCVSPVVRAFCVALNDGLDDDPRQRLRLYLPRTIGTAGDGLDERRAWMAMDWLVREYTPTWLSAAGVEEAAERLRSLTEVSAVEHLKPALEVLHRARRQACARWGSARTGRLTSGMIARATARESAWATAAAAAWAAARIGVGDMAGDRARAAARAAAGDAAMVLTREAIEGTGRSAAREAARAALAPTLIRLQHSAFALLDQMLPLVAHPELDAASADLTHA